jgi:serine/threonine protein kinase
MASVYSGRHVKLDHMRAIKVMSSSLAANPSFVRLFHREAGLAAILNHPNIVRTYDIAEQDGTPYLVMELLIGRSLRDVVRGDWPISLERVSHLLSQLAAALDYAHEHAIAHRDIKPSNVFVAPNDHLTLVDFGIARAADATHLTVTHGIGTPEYMAPEVFDERLSRPGADNHTLGVDADLYALGVVAYELLTGRLPFSGRSPQSVAFAHVHHEPPTLRSHRPELSEEIEAVVLTQLSKRPVERHAPARSFALALSDAVRLRLHAANLSSPFDQIRFETAERLGRDRQRASSRDESADARHPEAAIQRPQVRPLVHAPQSQTGALSPAATDNSRAKARDLSRLTDEPAPGGLERPTGRHVQLFVPITLATVMIIAIALVLVSGASSHLTTPVAPNSTEEPVPVSGAAQIPGRSTIAVVTAPTSVLVAPQVMQPSPTVTAVPVTPTPSFEERIEGARRILDGGNLPAALQALGDLKRSDPGAQDVDILLYAAHVRYGYSLLDSRQLDESWGEFEAALALRPRDEVAETGKRQIILVKSWDQMESAWSTNPETAIGALETILAIDLEYRDGEARQKLYSLLIAKADRYLEAAERADAFPILLRAQEVYPAGAEAMQRLATYTPTPAPTPPSPPTPRPAPPSNSGPVSSQPARSQPANGQATNNQPATGQPGNSQPGNGPPASGQLGDGQPASSQPANNSRPVSVPTKVPFVPPSR